MDGKVAKKLEEFFIRYKHQEYKKGEILLRADDEPQGVFYLIKGVVRQYAISKEGIELTINIYKPLSFFPLLWVMNNRKVRYYYQALSSVSCYIAPKDDFEQFIKTEHDVAYDLLKRIYKGLEGYFMRMEFLLSGDAYARTITPILIHALRFGHDRNSIEVYLTQNQIASQAGLTRETVTREVKKLQDRGIVGYKGKALVVYDLTRLEEELLE